MSRRQKKRRKGKRIFGLVIILIIIGGGLLVVSRFFPSLAGWPFSVNRQIIDFHEYFALDSSVMGVIVEAQRITTAMPPKLDSQGQVLVPVSLIKEQIDPFIFWDEYAGTLFITTATDIYQFIPDAAEYWKNGERLSLNTPITRINERVYVPADFVMARYPYKLDYQPAHNMLIITDRTIPHTLGTTPKKTDIRYRPEETAPVTKRAEKGEVLTLYGDEGDFTRVRTGDGLLGYVLTSSIDDRRATEKDSEIVTVLPPPGSPRPINGKINLMWDTVYGTAGNQTLMANSIPDGVNVISPTWFVFDSDTKDLVSYASKDYVDWAHEQGCQVWAHVADESETQIHALLTDASKRRQVINQLVGYVETLGLDGINIDFELVPSTDGDYFIEFLRELAPALRAKKAVLSVDVFVPAAFSTYYSRDRVGKTADFVCVMTYDEHYPGGASSGPVASLPFVEKGVKDMLELVPKEKLLMGLPFFNRVWRELLNNDSAETRKVQNIGMERAKTLFSDKGAELVWQADLGYYYGEYAAVEGSETVLYRLWLEDEHSIAEKLSIFEANDLAGVAGWQRGLENATVHVLLKNSCNP